CHNFPFPFGNIQVKAGPLMVHGGLFNITISGPGGHGSAPHVTKDPIIAAGHIILAMQTITSRIHGGEADNVIPSSVKLSGTIRDFSSSVEATIKQRMTAIVESTSAAFDLYGEIEFIDMYPVVVNPKTETNIVETIAARVVGADKVSDAGLPNDPQNRFCHSDGFDFNDRILPLGIRMFVEIVHHRLNCTLFNANELDDMTANLLKPIA
ncbi:unnamed protein product, partial [Aphanomyces euteiches]